MRAAGSAPTRVTHDVARADAALAQTHVRAPARLPGEALDRRPSTRTACSCRLARERALRLRHGREPIARRTWRALFGCAVAPSRRCAASSRTTCALARRLRAAARRSTSRRGVDARRRAAAAGRVGRRRARRAGGARRGRQGRGARVARRAAARASAGWAVLAPDLRGTGESAAGRVRAGDGGVDARPRPARAARRRRPAPPSQWLSERYSTGQQLDKRAASPCTASGAFGAGRPARGGARRAHRGRRRAARSPTSLEELLVESPRDHADGVPVPRARDVRPGRPRAARRAAAAARGGAGERSRRRRGRAARRRSEARR